MNYKIDKKDWHICKLCHKTIKELAKLYGGSNIYYTTVFKKHIEQDHNMKLEEYFDNRPICACNICKQMCDIGGIRNSNFHWKKYKCGRTTGTMQWSKQAKINRCGANNPMYGQVPWNKNKTKNDNASLKIVSEKQTGRIISQETRKKQSISAKKRKIHGHTGHKHSKKTIEKLRQNTLRLITNGVFNHLKTKPHIAMTKILDELNIVYYEEQIVDVWSFDFFIPKYNLYIEVDGDYFHSHPKKYPQGPQTKTQKINWYRDIKKNQFCNNNNLLLLRFWECDILNNKDKIICALKKYLQ